MTDASVKRKIVSSILNPFSTSAKAVKKGVNALENLPSTAQRVGSKAEDFRNKSYDYIYGNNEPKENTTLSHLSTYSNSKPISKVLEKGLSLIDNIKQSAVPVVESLGDVGSDIYTWGKQKDPKNKEYIADALANRKYSKNGSKDITKSNISFASTDEEKQNLANTGKGDLSVREYAGVMTPYKESKIVQGILNPALRDIQKTKIQADTPAYLIKRWDEGNSDEVKKGAQDAFSDIVAHEFSHQVNVDKPETFHNFLQNVDNTKNTQIKDMIKRRMINDDINSGLYGFGLKKGDKRTLLQMFKDQPTAEAKQTFMTEVYARGGELFSRNGSPKDLKNNYPQFQEDLNDPAYKNN